MTATIQRVKRLIMEDIKECIRESRPVIATEMMKSWKASSRWSFEFFKEYYGSDMVKLSDGRFPYTGGVTIGPLYRFHPGAGSERHV